MLTWNVCKLCKRTYIVSESVTEIIIILCLLVYELLMFNFVALFCIHPVFRKYSLYIAKKLRIVLQF